MQASACGIRPQESWIEEVYRESRLGNQLSATGSTASIYTSAPITVANWTESARALSP